MKARDVMSPNVVSVSADMKVSEIAALMLERRISAVPVLDGAGHVAGIVSEGDLIRRPEIETDKPRARWLRFFLSQEDRARDFVKTHGLHARDVMSAPAICVAPDTPLDEVVDLLARRRIKRVVVTEKGRLAGIVTRTDLLRALHAREALPRETVPADDSAIRDQVLAILRDEDWAASAIVNVQVANGIVYLWGVVDSDEQRRALRVAVEGVPGVRSIEDHLGKLLAG